MKRVLLIAAIFASSFAGVTGASARVEFGRPDFPNYLSPPGHGTCDFWRTAWFRACDGVVTPPPEYPSAAAAAAAPAPTPEPKPKGKKAPVSK